MHMPNPGSGPRHDDEVDGDVRQPVVPPDQADDVVPVEEPPQQPGADTPKIVREDG